MRKRPTTKVIAEPDGVLPVSGAVIGYARVSTAEQNLDMQIDALNRHGCDRIYSEKVSAASSRRPQLEHALRQLREGDTFVVWKMDRLARSLSDLMRRVEYIKSCGSQFVSLTERIDTASPTGRLLFHVIGALGEFERDLILERTNTGIKRAKAEGKRFGAERKFTDKQIAAMQRDRDKGLSIRQLASRYGCSIGTVRNWTTGPGMPARTR